MLLERYVKDTSVEKAAPFGLVGKDAVRFQVGNPCKALIEKVGTRQLRGFRDFLIGDLRLILRGGDGFDRLYLLIIVELDFDRGILVTAEKDHLGGLLAGRLVLSINDRNTREPIAQRPVGLRVGLGFALQTIHTGAFDSAIFFLLLNARVNHHVGDATRLGRPRHPLMVMPVGGRREHFSGSRRRYSLATRYARRRGGREAPG